MRVNNQNGQKRVPEGVRSPQSVRLRSMFERAGQLALVPPHPRGEDEKEIREAVQCCVFSERLLASRTTHEFKPVLSLFSRLAAKGRECPKGAEGSSSRKGHRRAKGRGCVSASVRSEDYVGKSDLTCSNDAGKFALGHQIFSAGHRVEGIELKNDAYAPRTLGCCTPLLAYVRTQ